MLLKLSIQSLKKSIKDYAVYFFTLIIGVTIFYLFNAIKSQSAMMEISESKREIIELMNSTMAGVSVFVAIILGFLIIYASQFLMKRRNKEFGLYLLLGMGKRKVSLILFFETVIIGIVSLLVGLVCGVLLSQLTSVFVSSMFEANMKSYRFIFSKEACMRTIMCFVIIYLVVIVFNTLTINKCKLIDLFQASKKSQKIKIKNPIVCVIVFIAAVAILAYAYNKVCFRFSTIKNMQDILIYIFMGIIGTFLVFWSVSGMILKVITCFKKVYYKGLNSFTFRQISSRINTMVVSMTIICIMLFVTICVLASSLMVRNSLNANLNGLAPADFSMYKQIIRDGNETSQNTYNLEKEVTGNSLTIVESYKNMLNYDIVSNLKEYADVSVYRVDDFTMGASLGSRLEEITNQYKYLTYDSVENIVKLSEYNKAAKLYGKQEIKLADNEYAVVADFKNMVLLRNQPLESGEKITIFNHELTPAYNECVDGFLEISGNASNSGFFVVPDDIVDESCIVGEELIGNYNGKSQSEKDDIEKDILKITNLENYDLRITIDTKNDIKEASNGLGCLVAFVGLYVGIIFLISGAAILALKELSESADNIERYNTLKKLGTDDKLINKSIFKQIAIFFGCPLVLSIIHSIFGMIFSRNVLEVFGTEKMFISIITTAVIMLFIYGGYFIITYVCSKNIVNSRYIKN